MKKTLAILTVLAISMVSTSAWAVGCGANPGRNTPTRAPASTTTGGSTGTMGPAAGAGMGPGSVLPR